jgi:hypothetical protein
MHSQAPPPFEQIESLPRKSTAVRVRPAQARAPPLVEQVATPAEHNSTPA